MKLQKFNVVILFIVLFATLSMYGMEQENKELHLFIFLPRELHQLIIFPCGIALSEITDDNVDYMNEHIKVFFNMNRVCKHLHTSLKFPWLDVKFETKNSMMLDVLALMEQRSYEQYCTQDAKELRWYKHAELVSFGYKKYRIISLALVYSGSCADIVKDGRNRLEEKNYLHAECEWCKRIARYGETSCLSKAMHAQDVKAIKFLLDHGADIYQKSLDEQGLAWGRRRKLCRCFYNMIQRTPELRMFPIWVRSPTIEIAQLCCEKTDKQTLLSHPDSCWAYFELEHDYYTLDLMKFWFDYGIEAKRSDGKSIIEDFVVGLWLKQWITIDNFCEKAVILLEKYPDQINIQHNNRPGKTLLDLLETDEWCSEIDVNDRERIIALLRKHGGKTAQELAEENTQLITQQEIHETTKL